jgi:hypothetical protein
MTTLLTATPIAADDLEYFEGPQFLYSAWHDGTEILGTLSAVRAVVGPIATVYEWESTDEADVYQALECCPRCAHFEVSVTYNSVTNLYAFEDLEIEVW